MASLSTCHLGLCLGWQILLNLVKCVVACNSCGPLCDILDVAGYTSILSSKGIMVDVTSPDPGHVSKVKMDSIKKVNCKSFVPTIWQHRCVVDSPTANYRYDPHRRPVVGGPITWRVCAIYYIS